MDALFARMSVSSGNEAWYLVDMLGTVRDIRDQAFADIYHAEYDSYGIITEETGSGGDRYKWTGREWQAEIDLQYNRARYYDPSIGRWISQDPIGFDAGDGNLYRYVQNEPASAIDPNGLQMTPRDLANNTSISPRDIFQEFGESYLLKMKPSGSQMVVRLQ